MSKLVYIAGPYTAETHSLIEHNINVARTAAIWCAEHEIHYFCPHLNTAHFEFWAPKVSRYFYYEMDLNILRRCDAILLLANWETSIGSRVEQEVAELLDLRRFEWPADLTKLHKWAKENNEADKSLRDSQRIP